MSLEIPTLTDLNSLDVKTTLLDITRTVYVNERDMGLSIDPGSGKANWTADPAIFLQALAIDCIIVRDRLAQKLVISQATFRTADGDTLKVERDKEEDLNDAFCRDIFLKPFLAIYTHDHELCLDALRHRRQEKEAVQGCRETIDSMQAGQLGFVVKDKRRLAS